MRGARLVIGSLLLAVSPAAAFAQAGVTPLLTEPAPLRGGQLEFGGYVTIEDEIDLFGVFRQGLGQDLDYGLRAGYTDAGGGGLHIGGDLRFGLADPTEDLPLGFGLVGGLQVTLADDANLISVPFGVSIGAEVGSPERKVTLFGLPRLEVDRVDPDVGESDTDLEFAVELGAKVELTNQIRLGADLTISSHDDDNVSLALGLSWRR